MVEKLVWRVNEDVVGTIVQDLIMVMVTIHGDAVAGGGGRWTQDPGCQT